MSGVFKLILSDLKSHVNAQEHQGLKFWAVVFAKTLFSPGAHAGIIYRISHQLWRNPITRPLSFLLKYFSVIYCTAEIYPSAVIGPGFCVSHSQMVMIGNGVRIGSNFRITPGALVSSDAGAASSDGRKGFPEIGDNVFIGMQTSVVGAVKIGDNASVAAHSLVIKDVPANTLVGGVPAKVLKVLSESELRSS